MADIYGLSARVLVNGRKVREYSHNGKLFIESKNKTEFEIELKNHKPHRVMAIVSVDGLDVIGGKPATNESSGYIIPANDSVRIKGFRKDNETVGSFKFTSRDNAYSESQGQGGNQGVISVRFFDEKQKQTHNLLFDAHVDMPKPRRIYGQSRKLSNSSGEATYMSSVSTSCDAYISQSSINEEVYDFDMGTTWGSKKNDKVTAVEFDRGGFSGELNLYYASRDGLINMGVPLTKQNYISLPKGFNDFATPPTNWKG